MIYIVISIRERSTRILTDHISKKKYFTDLALAKEKLYKDFALSYSAKTDKTLSKEEFNRMKGKCTIAWINDVNGADYDIQILSIEK